MEFQSDTWSGYMHHNTFELLVFVFSYSTIALSEFYARRTSNNLKQS